VVSNAAEVVMARRRKKMDPDDVASTMVRVTRDTREFLELIQKETYHATAMRVPLSVILEACVMYAGDTIRLNLRYGGREAIEVNEVFYRMPYRVRANQRAQKAGLPPIDIYPDTPDGR
jgi:hypothetical protein